MNELTERVGGIGPLESGDCWVVRVRGGDEKKVEEGKIFFGMAENGICGILVSIGDIQIGCAATFRDIKISGEDLLITNRHSQKAIFARLIPESESAGPDGPRRSGGPDKPSIGAQSEPEKP